MAREDLVQSCEFALQGGTPFPVAVTGVADGIDAEASLEGYELAQDAAESDTHECVRIARSIGMKHNECQICHELQVIVVFLPSVEAQSAFYKQARSYFDDRRVVVIRKPSFDECDGLEKAANLLADAISWHVRSEVVLMCVNCRKQFVGPKHDQCARSGGRVCGGQPNCQLLHGVCGPCVDGQNVEAFMQSRPPRGTPR